MGIIANLQNKSPKTKKRIAFAVSASITLLIAVIWFVIWKSDSQEKTAVQETQPTEAVADVFGSGFASIKKQFSDLFGSMKNFGAAGSSQSSTTFQSATTETQSIEPATTSDSIIFSE